MRSPALVAALLVALSACGGDDGTPVADGGSADGATATRAAIPWLAEGAPAIDPPSLGPCPEGWREVTDGDGIPFCDPWPEGEPTDCGPGEAHFPGGPGCEPLGSPCPAWDFPMGLPADSRIVYVQPGSVGGDGTLGAPFGSTSEIAVGGLGRGATIALSKGRHEGPVRLPIGIAIVGACAAETELVSEVPGVREGVIQVVGADVLVRDLRIGPSRRPGIRVDLAAAAATLRGVEIAEAEAAGIVVTGAVVAEGLAVRDTRALTGGGTLGRGVELAYGGAFEARRAVFERNRFTGIFAGTEPTLVLEDVAVRDTEGQAGDLTGGRGLGLEDGAHGTLRRVVIDGNREEGLYASDEGTSVLLEDVVVRSTRSVELDGTNGEGVNVQQGATLEARRVLVEGNRGTAILLNGARSASIEDALLRDQLGQEGDGMFGRGIGVQDGSTATLTRVALIRNLDIGVYVARDGATATLAHVSILDTLPQQSDGADGRGANVQEGGVLSASNLLIEQARNVAFFVAGAGTRVDLVDIVARDTLSDDRLRGGRALNVQDGGRVEGLRVLLERSRDVAVIVGHPGSELSLQDAVIRGTAERACAPDGCPPAGHGLAALESGVVRLSGFTLSGATLCGVLLASDASVDLSAGEVTSNRFGACIQIDGYDVGRLTDEVAYQDNELNLESTSLPVPMPAAPL